MQEQLRREISEKDKKMFEQIMQELAPQPINDDASIGAAEVQPAAPRSLGEPVANLTIDPIGWYQDVIADLEKRVAAIEAWMREQTR